MERLDHDSRGQSHGDMTLMLPIHMLLTMSSDLEAAGQELALEGPR